MVSNEPVVALDTYGEVVDRSDPMAIGLKNELKRYFLDTLRKLEKWLANNEFAQHGYSKHYLENTVVWTLQKKADFVHEQFPGANSISFELEHMLELQ